ncbi:copper chaperone PCu(A)C [Oricola sp.]|uniref:copper chaperone PCu(A)C n=1 Tax=Oricola sp. TaxID=1979950 RepID=UPI00320BE381|nr:copper chaperone PCu(A)C [Oricola sp.]
MIRVFSAALTASICLFQPDFVTTALAGDHEDHSHHEGGIDGVRTVHAWAQATTGKTALVFVDIDNESDRDIAVTGGESAIVSSVELVGFQLKDGEPVYVALPPVPIKAGTEMTLTPDGLALRLNGLATPLVEGDEHEIGIEFDFGHVEMLFQVEASDARHHSHAGHQH